jgi:tellurite resistance protein TerC
MTPVLAAERSGNFVDVTVHPWQWMILLGLIVGLLLLDLLVFHREAHEISTKEAAIESAAWISVGVGFMFVVIWWFGGAAGGEYISGYLIEKSLSVDNVFVWALLMAYFLVPRMYQHRVLFWGILGALAMRGAMIAIGARLVAEFSWILSVFGAVLVLTALKMLFMKTETGDPSQNIVVRLMKRFLPVTDQFAGEHFFVRAVRGGWTLTPLVPALVMVETTDLVFAVDSIPAIFAITADPFLVFTSNVFAILGLRSLYFALAGALHVFRYLKQALALVLLTVGGKMLAHTWLERVLGPDFNLYMLAAVIVILATGVLVSLVELRWRAQIRRTMSRAAHTLQEWIVPDRLIETIDRAGQTRSVRRRRAQRSATRVPLITRLRRALFIGKGGNVSILVASHLLEESEQYAMYFYSVF